MQPTHFKPDLWVGNINDGTNFEWLRRFGIRNIANLTGIECGQTVAGFNTLLLSQEDGEPILPETLRRFFDWMAQQIGPTFIHCHAGISRASSFTIAWRMYQEGDSDNPLIGDPVKKWLSVTRRWDRFETELMRVRPWIRPHPQLKQSIIEYFISEGL